MARRTLSTFFARLRPPPGAGGDAATDAELLRRWADGRDRAAFELIVWRHGPLVLGTCRRVCRSEADAEDSFQATFLVLARKAGGVRSSLPGWLHRTARRAALRASRRRRETSLSIDLPAISRDGLDADELAHLDAAIDGLGERHRRVVVLCYLQGHSTEDAAKLLGVPRGTVLSRLATARERLAATLTRRGVALPAALTATTLAFDRVSACVRLTLDPRTAAPAAAIAQGVLVMIRLKTAATAAVLLFAGVSVTGTGVALMPQAGGQVPTPAPAAAEPVNPAAAYAATASQIAATERKLADAVEQWKASLPKVPPGELRAKAELLGAIDLLIFKSEVEIRKLELQIEPLQKNLEEINNLTLTEEQILAYAGQHGIHGSNELNELGLILSRAKQMKTPRKGMGSVNPSPAQVKRAEEEYEKYKPQYLALAAKEIDALNRSHRETLAKFKVPDIKLLTDTMTKEKLTLSVTIEKRKAIADELAKLEAVPAEPAGVAGLRKELTTLSANREAMKARHPELFDPATRSAVAMEKVLQELIDLRAEVKRLREAK